MTEEERAEMERLCKQIAIEKDPLIFDRLVQDLLTLLDKKHTRIHPDHKRTL